MTNKIRSAFRNLFHRDQLDRDLEAEVRSYADLLQEEKMFNGMNSADAKRSARMNIGGPEQLKEEVRSARAGAWLETLWQDFRFGARMLRKNPGFTAIAVLTLALGIGPNTAMFSVLNAVLLRPLPYPHAERIVVLQESIPQNAKMSVSFPDFQDWQKQQHSFSHLALYRRFGVSFTGSGEPERLSSAVTTSDLFQILKFTPVVGRTFSPAEDLPGSTPSVVLSYRLWQRRFSGDANIIGKAITLNATSFTVVGVLPDIPAIPRGVELWTSFGLQAARPELNRRNNHMGYSALAQLNAGATIDQARDEFSAIASRIAKQFPDSNTGEGVVLTPILETMVGEYRSGLILLAGAVGFVLLIACANLASLLLAKGEGRQQELALRAALGAARTRIVRQLLTESTIIALLGGFVGVLLAYWAKDAMLALAPAGPTRFAETQLDGAVLLFALGLSLLAGLIFGLLPAWKLARTDLRNVMQDGGRNSSGGSAKRRASQMLVTSEVALTLVLLVGAGLLVQSLAHLESVNLGFDPNNLLMAVVDLSPATYGNDAKINVFYDQLLTRVRALPGVRGATLNSSPPLDNGWETGFDVEGRPPYPAGKGPAAEISVIDPQYFRVMGIPLLRGRSFSTQDSPDSPPSVMIDEAFARRIWPGEDPIGKRLLFWVKAPPAKALTVVGVVPTVGIYGYGEAPSLLQLYLPQSQVAQSNPTLLVRSAGDPSALAPSVRRIVFDMDPNQPVFAVRTLDHDLKDSISSPRLIVSLLSFFASLALLLAICGIYGVVSYGVSQRTREIGIRVALGATPSEVLWLVLRQGARPAVFGVAIGIASSLALTRLLKSLLFGIDVTDPATFVIVPMTLMLVVFLACYVPARRATRVDPMIALRHE